MKLRWGKREFKYPNKKIPKAEKGISWFWWCLIIIVIITGIIALLKIDF